MESLILTDPMVTPENNILENALGKSYKLYMEFMDKTNELKLVPEWNYYNDGKSWFCKILNKKKNICWLSIWSIGFKLAFYFTEKTIDGIYKLDIDNEIKKCTKEIKSIGKLRPAIILIKNRKMLSDGLKILEYKMTLK